MPDPQYVATFGQLDEEMIAWLTADGLATAVRGIAKVEIPDETLAIIDHLQARAKDQQCHMLDVALHEDIDVGPALATFVIMQTMYLWSEGGHSAFPAIEDAIRGVWPDAASETGSYESRVVDGMLQGVLGLALLGEESDDAAPAVANISTGFLKLADLFLDHGDGDIALSSAQVAANVVAAFKTPQAAQISARTLAIARQAANQDSVAAEAARHARLLVEVAQKDPAQRLAAFDAVERALLSPTDDLAVRDVMRKMLVPVLEKEPYLKELNLLLWAKLTPEERDSLLVLPALEREEMLEHLESLSVATEPVWNGELKEWSDRFAYVREWSIMVENLRLGLEARPPNGNPRAVWGNWTIDHPSLRRAVPHHRSILRERNLQEILLNIGHEVTHIYSMAGFLGLASLAMRWALLDLELTLLTVPRSDGEQEDPVQLMHSLAPTRLPGATDKNRLLALAEAEQAIEVERKIQILESAWEPWFEGLALFGELAADPLQDSLARTTILDVIFNLWDRNPEQLAREADVTIDEAVQREYHAAETLYNEAMTISFNRLFTYLGRDYRKYLAGYFVVRSIVAAWRFTLDKPLSGAEAFRTLLHLTRYSSFDEIPDLGLPLEEFSEAVERHQSAWLSKAARITREDLERIVWKLGNPLQWRDGRLVEIAEGEEPEQDVIEILKTFGRQALSSNRGDNARIERVPEADEVCQYVMESAAGALTQGVIEPHFFDPATSAVILPRLMILPLGRASCPFWLHPRENSLACLIRTRETDQTTGKPSYDLIWFPLSPEETSALRDEIGQSGERRMTVTRVSDLGGDLESGRPAGINYLVFEYGDWMHIQPRGLWFGVSEAAPALQEAIADRFNPPQFVVYQERLTAEDHSGALRTKEWVNAHDWVVDFAGVELDITAWAQRVAHVADVILVYPTPLETQAHALRLLRWVFGNTDGVTELGERGFAVLRDNDPAALEALIHVLDASARYPLAQDLSAENFIAYLAEDLTPLLEHSAQGWDVLRPMELRMEGPAR